MATTNITYNNPNKRNGNRIDNSNRFAINKDVLRMMAQNPTLGIGYLIGTALGENYWGKKRANSTQKAVDDALNEYNKNLPANTSGEMDWDAANKLLDAYAGQNNTAGNMVNGIGIQDAMASKSGWAVPPSQSAVAPVPAEAPAAPLTPQQANAPAVTFDNAGVLGGATTMQDAWEQMKNSGTFNNGNTGYFTNGIRNLDNVVTTGTQAPALDPRFLALLNETQKKNWFGK